MENEVNKKMQRIPYTGTLPENFLNISRRVYKDLSFSPRESEADLLDLFRLEADRNEIIFYTDHYNMRLVGIFPEGESVAYFGFWETVDDLVLNKKTFDILIADAKRLTRNSIVGPVNFNTYHQYRLRVGETPSWHMFDREPVNPDYYNILLKKLGFEVKALFESRLIKKENIEDFYISKEMLMQQIHEIPFHFLPLNKDNWLKYQQEIFEITTAIFQKNLLYKAISFDQFRLLYNKAFAKKICPHSSVIFVDKSSGKLAAISMCHPNYTTLDVSEKIPEFDRDFSGLPEKTLLAKTIGVHPDYRQQGLMTFLGIYGMLSFKKWYDDVIFCLMRSGNHSLHFSDPFNYEKAEYALYEKSIM